MLLRNSLRKAARAPGGAGESLVTSHWHSAATALPSVLGYENLDPATHPAAPHNRWLCVRRGPWLGSGVHCNSEVDGREGS